jgi:hypothetical protein
MGAVVFDVMADSRAGNASGLRDEASV